MVRLQNGIYYKDQPPRTNKNNCFAIAFLRVDDRLTSFEIGDYIASLWKMYKNLKKGRVIDLPQERVPLGDLSVLISFGPNTFNIPGLNKKMPRDLRDRQFREPNSGEPILDGSGIMYGFHHPRNLGNTEHIAVQFISKSQLATYRGVVETWKYIATKKGMQFTTFFTGFQRDDGRSWLGFHDEVSNMRNSREKRNAIMVDGVRNDLIHRDFWTTGGSYLAFLRIEINLPSWEQIERRDQEILIGRDKLTGIPIVGIDKNGKPIKRADCPPHSDVQSFDKRFHEHPNYFQKPANHSMDEDRIDIEKSVRFLSQSHIGRTRHTDHIKSDDPASRRIFRQGFEFIEPTYNDTSRPLRLGLNFVSFQNDPSRLLFILTDPNWLGESNFAGTGNIPGMKDFLTVHACGIFFVPPNEKPFPGVSIFK